ncbi:hypothetical protein [Parageobacillus galactosidasius]|uniref:Uncharacterized protein n=1 Tax=Parageobacillus galactosidasius TaxID=883812 RepID=A0A226QR37_9BACL|nr:hypothetical protein [Parageobacillus galactosidasius]OXB94805.1 hypothetical protein B9L23_08055 [Parageobacillus galactosidasius]
MGLNFSYKVGSMQVQIPQTDLIPEMNINLENVEVEVQNLDLKDVMELIKTVKELKPSYDFDLNRLDFNLTK